MLIKKTINKLNFPSYLFRAVHTFIVKNKGRTFRQKVFSLLHPTPTSGKLHRIIDNIIVLSVLASVVSIILETVPWIHKIFHWEFYLVELVTVVIFTTEYIGRVYSCCELPKYQRPGMGRLRYMVTIGALIDLLAVLPFFIGLIFHEAFDLRFLRVFRLSRLLKLTRYTGTLNTMYKAIYRERRVLFAAAFMMILLVILTASLGYEFEHLAQPDKFDTIPDTMYWAVITLASVGYGDLTPITPMGRAMTVVISLIGIGIFAIPAGLMASAFTDQLRIDREAFENEFRDAIAKGKLTPGDRQALEAEAERLHLSMEDVDRITDRVRNELTAAGAPMVDGLSPALLLEKYRQHVSQLKVFCLTEQVTQIEPMLQDSKNATELERQIWILINQKSS